jgi:hypothetical protein
MLITGKARSYGQTVEICLEHPSHPSGIQNQYYSRDGNIWPKLKSFILVKCSHPWNNIDFEIRDG